MLFIAGDRSLTRMHAEALLRRSWDAPPDAEAAWEAARAHSAVEATAVVEFGGRPFDAVVVAPTLPDEDGLGLVSQLRRLEATREVPVFMLSERGHDRHDRRIAAVRYRLAGFIELPANAEQIRTALEVVRRRRRVLVVDADEARAERYRSAFTVGGLVAEVCTLPADARSARRRLDPDLVAVALEGPSSETDGLEVCARLKRDTAPPKVILYGPWRAISQRGGIAANAERADDFVRAPFDDELLVQRAQALVGIGGSEAALPSATASARHEDAPPTTSSSRVDLPPLAARARARAHSTTAAPVPRASPRRSARRVPCEIEIVVEEDQRRLRTHTLDISPGGLFFEIAPPPPVGAPLRLRFTMPDGRMPIEAEGGVAWLDERPGSEGVGVRFTKIDPDDLQSIVDYVNRLAQVLYDPSPGSGDRSG